MRDKRQSRRGTAWALTLTGVQSVQHKTTI